MPARHALCALVLAVVFASTACSSSDNGPASDPLVTQTEDLFPSGTTGTQATALATDLVTAANTGDLATARSKAFSLTELTLSEYAAGHLSDPASTLPDRLDTYITDIFSKASLGAPPLGASSFGPEGIVAVVRPAGGTFINSSLRAGIAIPDGALTEPTLLVADRLPDASAWAQGAGPLPTSLTQYPLYLRIHDHTGSDSAAPMPLSALARSLIRRVRITPRTTPMRGFSWRTPIQQTPGRSSCWIGWIRPS